MENWKTVKVSLAQRLLKECGVKWLFAIQYLSYNLVFDGRDLIGQARWGEGEGVKCVCGRRRLTCNLLPRRCVLID